MSPVASRYSLVPLCRLLIAIVLAMATACSAVAQRDQQEGDIFPAPEGSTAEILKFIEDLADKEPESEDEEELVAVQSKVLRSIAAAAQQALEAGPADEDEATQAHYYRLQALSLLTQLEEPGAAEALEKAIEAARKSKAPSANAVAIKFFLESQFARWPELADDQRNNLVSELLRYLKSTELDRNDAETVRSVADFLAMQGDYDLGARLIKQSLPLFANSGLPRRDAIAADLGAIARRLSLPGQKMEIEGAYLNGDEFQWKPYEGKVVLVDFWATWCGPCRAELPNVLNMYEAYHDQGFEVLGISLDDDPEQAAAFMEKMELPWRTLFSADETARGWRDPNAVKYGVNGIPLAILLDREGKVVSMTARGPELKRLLFELLGPPGDDAKAASE